MLEDAVFLNMSKKTISRLNKIIETNKTVYSVRIVSYFFLIEIQKKVESEDVFIHFTENIHKLLY